MVTWMSMVMVGERSYAFWMQLLVVQGSNLMDYDGDGLYNKHLSGNAIRKQ